MITSPDILLVIGQLFGAYACGWCAGHAITATKKLMEKVL